MKNRCKTAGFTIVELLVVIVVIAILAGISYFILSGWRVETARTEVKNDLKNVETELEAYRTFNNAYPTQLSQLEYEKTNSVDITYRYDSAQNTYCVNAASNVESTVQYFSDSSARKSIAEGTC